VNHLLRIELIKAPPKSVDVLAQAHRSRRLRSPSIMARPVATGLTSRGAVENLYPRAWEVRGAQTENVGRAAGEIGRRLATSRRARRVGGTAMIAVGVDVM